MLQHTVYIQAVGWHQCDALGVCRSSCDVVGHNVSTIMYIKQLNYDFFFTLVYLIRDICICLIMLPFWTNNFKFLKQLTSYMINYFLFKMNAFIVTRQQTDTMVPNIFPLKFVLDTKTNKKAHYLNLNTL